jgi:SAM-dependent methyltransferase
MNYNAQYFDRKWESVIRLLPVGGSYRFDLRQYAYDIIKKEIKSGSRVFDYACGLGVIDIQLAKEKNCKVSGCDYSQVAVDYVKKKSRGEFRKTDKVFGDKYDYILAIYFLEHIKNPVEWLNDCFKNTNKAICVIPNDFRQYGEHIDMQWKDWDSFDKLFKGFKVTRLDTGRYPKGLCRAFNHPIFMFEKKKGVSNDFNSSYQL